MYIYGLITPTNNHNNPNIEQKQQEMSEIIRDILQASEDRDAAQRQM